MYSRSHFTKGPKIMLLPAANCLLNLWICNYLFNNLYASQCIYVVPCCHLIFCAIFFNIFGFEWKKKVVDWDDWSKWVKSEGIDKDVILLKDGIFSRVKKHVQIMKDI
ncbi:hypothetical protein KFK09_027338 [Dendrobium nobile]|uniref:Uncharacterized protein n=1 Tax=Dendrobium nobile TaxID=94219 RepID=A0A8T3ABA7_DENNO|nr:hypothetical protein KFK09_027338 [Dendrobium nobile]